MIDYPVRLSTTEPNNPVGVLKIRQDDKGTQKIVARITTNSKPQDLTGLEVAFNMRTTDGNVVIEKAVVKDAKLGIIEYVVSGFATQKAARNNAYFSFFIGEDEQFSTKDFSYFVTNSVTSEGIRGCDYIWKFEDLLEYVTDLANQAQIQLNKLTSDVHLIQKQIDDMFALIESQGVLSADEVRQLMINFMSGQDIEVTVKSDFAGKIAGSILENKNIVKYALSTSLPAPNASNWTELDQVRYTNLAKLDGANSTLVTVTNGVMIPKAIYFDLFWILEKNFPQIFKNATTTAEKLVIAKEKITSSTVNAYAKGSGPSGNKVTMSLRNPRTNVWEGSRNNTTANISLLSYPNVTPNATYYMDDNGVMPIILYSEASNGTVQSIVSVDYANIELKVKFNISEFVATKAQYEALKSSYTALKLVVDDHVVDAVKHITAAERTKWNAKQDVNFKQVTGVPGLNGWYAYNNTGILITREGRLVNITCQLNAGVQTSGTEMLTLPDWAIPQVGGTTLTAMSVSKDWAYKPCTVVVRGNKLIVGANVDNFLTIISVTYIAAA